VRPLPGRLVLLGHPVNHSLSPTFQNAALRRAGFPLRYEALDVTSEALDAMLDSLIAANASGNVTIPHKERVAARCARLSPLAERVGAVNTFWIENGTLVGDNTDVGGFLHLLHATAPDVDRGQPVALLGAGGSAAGVLAALEQDAFLDVRVHARTPTRAHTLCGRFPSSRMVETIEDAVRGASLVVNSTPVGMDGETPSFDVGLLQRSAAVIDLIVRRDETPLVRAARARGHRAADGLEMLLEQGALAFERWFGVAPDRAVMRESVAR
jgi:shikimate dehydrogenase